MSVVDITSHVLSKKNQLLQYIGDYMRKGYEDRCAGHPPELTQLDVQFWEGVTCAFIKHFQKIDYKYRQETIETRHRNRKKKNVVETTHIFWRDETYPNYQAISDLNYIFSLLSSRCLKYSENGKKYQDMFAEIIGELRACEKKCSTHNKEKIGKYQILGRVRFIYIEKMLDLQNDAVCEVLPFLLTAYVYNFRKNRFINRGSTAIEDVFSDVDFETKNAPKFYAQLENLKECFWFPEDSDITRQEKLSERPQPSTISFRSRPKISDVEVLNAVFDTWCTILSGNSSCKAQKIFTLNKKIDFVESYKLYMYYVCAAQYEIQANELSEQREIKCKEIDELTRGDVLFNAYNRYIMNQ